MTIRIPEFAVERWVNSPPLTAAALHGRVVLIDVWEYTCINWIRTSPYVKAWHRDYADRGLVVIGVHAPEFEFGKRAENIDRAIRDHGLTYPIALDNDFTFWRALGNIAWPARYLFDADGRFVDRWIGEGDYDRVESEIRRLLVAAAPGTELPPVSPEAAVFATTRQPSHAGVTPETYVGADRCEPGTFDLIGDWRSSGEYVELASGTGEIGLPFNAGEVNLVVDPGPSGTAAVRVLLDGKPIGDERGADVGPDAVAHLDRAAMVRLVAGASRDDHLLTLVTSQPGLRAFAFTFGP
ncbi:redoxin domain-containing protein [Micromonospora sp. DR5-3]|uniref:redoxin domain-containing protein n=1 Tax=unclassified Micromonospora TaxID=2617518 RepID=UPI0021058E01|nr:MULTISPECIES: redoxin domain-containing protein [unclassified Micromonospora]MCW3813579.1 redoxin domain-containing protein [Micromonospora sp. DR5-3]